MSYPGLLQPEPLPLSTADLYLFRRHPNTVLFQSLWGAGSWCTQICLNPLVGFILNMILPLLPSPRAYPLPLALDYLLKVTPLWHSCLSSAYHLAGTSLPLNMGYLLTVAPVLHSRWSIYQVLSILSLESFFFFFFLIQNTCKVFMTFIVLYYYLIWC